MGLNKLNYLLTQHMLEVRSPRCACGVFVHSSIDDWHLTMCQLGEGRQIPSDDKRTRSLSQENGRGGEKATKNAKP